MTPVATGKPALTGTAKAQSVGGKAYGKGGKKKKRTDKAKQYANTHAQVFGLK